MNNIKKYLTFDFLFPIIMVYFFMPVTGQIISATGIIEAFPIDFEFLYLLGAMFLSLWWILLHFDGTLKTALTWWIRYVVMIIPMWILHYYIYLDNAESYVFLKYLVVNIIGNLIAGLVGFGLRKLSRDSQLIYIIIAAICIYTLRPFGTWM